MHIRGREKYLEQSGGNLLFLQAVLTNVKIHESTKILEIGCGTGIFAQYFSTVTGAVITGTEMSEPAYKIASKRIPCFYRPKGDLPADIGLFDLLYCKDVMPINKNKIAFFKMIHAVLQPKGAFITYLPLKADILMKPVLNFIPGSIQQSASQYQPLQKNITALKKAGFKKVVTSKILLGTVKQDANYIEKHADGYFSNSDLKKLHRQRRKGLLNFEHALNELTDYGMPSFYNWERTLIIAYK